MEEARHITVELHLYKVPEQAKLTDGVKNPTNSYIWGIHTEEGTRELSGALKMFCILILEVATRTERRSYIKAN